MLRCFGFTRRNPSESASRSTFCSQTIFSGLKWKTGLSMQSSDSGSIPLGRPWGLLSLITASTAFIGLPPRSPPGYPSLIRGPLSGAARRRRPTVPSPGNCGRSRSPIHALEKSSLRATVQGESSCYPCASATGFVGLNLNVAPGFRPSAGGHCESRRTLPRRNPDDHSAWIDIQTRGYAP